MKAFIRSNLEIAGNRTSIDLKYKSLFVQTNTGDIFEILEEGPNKLEIRYVGDENFNSGKIHIIPRYANVIDIYAKVDGK